jgi:hypothetical protein
MEFFIVNPDFNSNASKDDHFSEEFDNSILPPDANKLLANKPQAFIENCGQLDNNDVRFYDLCGGIWFTDDGVWFELNEEIVVKRLYDYFDPMGRVIEPEPVNYKSMVLKLEFVGTNHVIPHGREPLGYYSNFFYGNDSSKWCTEVPNYQEIYYENLYAGIDLRYYTNKNGLKYDFIIHPGADVEQIRLRVEGSTGLEIDEMGNLIIKTEIKDVIDSGLFIYQNYWNIQHQVRGKFKVYNDSEFGFELLEDYNKQEVLIIDPTIELQYSAFIGGNAFEEGYAIDIDSKGDAFVTGHTSSIDFPNTTGAFDRTYNDNGNFWDIFILKLNQNGSNLIYSTYIGGNHIEHSRDITVDLAGNAFIVGQTSSSDFPTTLGAFDTTFNVSIDTFTLKLNQTGSSLIYSTYVGGDAQDWGAGIAIDSFGNAFVAGGTQSGNFPTTKNVYDIIPNYTECFVFKLNQDGSDLIYSTFIGGSYYDQGLSITVDTNGTAFVTGITNSSDFPTTVGAYDTILNGHRIIFVVKLNWNGSKLIYSTFVDGNGFHQLSKIAHDLEGNVYVTGWTNSSNFPTTVDAYDPTFNGAFDGFVFKLNNNGSKLIFSTYIGGSKIDQFLDLVVDTFGRVYLVGCTRSLDFPTTKDAYDNKYDNFEVFFLILNSNGSMIEYSTFIGGSKNELGMGIVKDSIGYVYITGYTNSSDFPKTPGAYNNSLTGLWYDCFILKILFPINITSIQLLENEVPTNLIYSKLKPYTFRVNITETVSLEDLKLARLILDPLGTNIQLQWNSATDQFIKVNDPNNYVILEQSSKAYNNSIQKWTLDFNLTFNWTYPDESFHDVRVDIISEEFSLIWKNETNFYRVENDLVFKGNLSVTNNENQTIHNYDLVRGGELMNWSGLMVVYKNTTDVYPPDNEYDVTIWNEDGYLGENSPSPGNNFSFLTKISSESDLDGDTHIINISGIPLECDKTDTKFTIRIDGDNVTFSDHKPDNNLWLRTSEVFTTVTITDTGGGNVENSSVMYCMSTDNGTTWSEWISIPDLISAPNIIAQKFVSFEDGFDNLIKWRAADSVGNGPDESENFKILVDTEEVEFTNPWPKAATEFSTEDAIVGITISDNTSGVMAATIDYSVSYDAGFSWKYWRSTKSFQDGNEIKVNLNLTFPNGTDNRIKWRAYDIAGNGPTISDEYNVNINIQQPIIHPEIVLVSPENNSKFTTDSVELSWILTDFRLGNVKYDIIFDSTYPPTDKKVENLTTSSLFLDDLDHGQTYYWTVIPKLDGNKGKCLSGVWTFKVEFPLPVVTLVSPKNGSVLQSPKPTLQWSVDYDGIGILNYDIYLDTIKDPKEFKKSTTLFYVPDSLLEVGVTYYWKVVPWTDDIQGIESEVWSFTINKEYLPVISINLTLMPSTVFLAPESIVFVKAFVTNLGELNDPITINIDMPTQIGVNAFVNKPSTIFISPNGRSSHQKYNIS